MPTIIAEDGQISIRHMEDNEHNYALMLKWLTNPEVLQYYGGRNQRFNLLKIKKKFSPRAKGKDPIKPCILTYEKQDIGYLQYFSVTDPKEYQLVDVENTFGIDLFIGEPSFRGKGIGSKSIKLLMGYIFNTLKAKRIVNDPLISNLRAIKSYEKCGFKKVKILKNQKFEGKKQDAWLMVKEN